VIIGSLTTWELVDQLVAAVEAEAYRRAKTALWADSSIPAARLLGQLGFDEYEPHVKAVGSIVFANLWMVKHLTQ
jgi:hypothetical protein